VQKHKTIRASDCLESRPLGAFSAVPQKRSALLALIESEESEIAVMSMSWLLPDDPVAANDSPKHQAQSRGIEIVFQPNLADLPSLDDVRLAL